MLMHVINITNIMYIPSLISQLMGTRNTNAKMIKLKVIITENIIAL